MPLLTTVSLQEQNYAIRAYHIFWFFRNECDGARAIPLNILSYELHIAIHDPNNQTKNTASTFLSGAQRVGA
jgi:hypothetical protein